MPPVRPSRSPAFPIALTVTLALAALVAWGGEPVTPAPPAKGTTVIRPGPATPRVATGQKDAQGKPVTVACVTCHATSQPNSATRSAAQLTQFHQGLTYQHGELTCLSCHNPRDYNTLRLADATALPFPDVMSLCSQCHGAQRRSYDHGAHGGMNGFWDLSRGGRQRNNCVTCHDPHAPAIPQVKPVLPPRDRISVPRASH